MKEQREEIEDNEVTEEKENDISSTPYDDVFRTMLNDCSSLIIPVLNEVFHEHYRGDEKIVFYPNEHFLNRQDGKEEKCITDTAFTVFGKVIKKYHLECQSTSDSSMLVRMFEYGSQIALDDGIIDGQTLYVRFPEAAILFLRSTANTPDAMEITIETPGGAISYEIPVLKMQQYTLEEIFEKKLLFLIPFYIFTHESRFEEYNKDEERLQILLKEYRDIRNRLEQMTKDGEIDEYIKRTILEMTNKVIRNIARKYSQVRKGAKNIMVGRVLDYEAKRILNKGREEGRAEGRAEGMEMLNIAHVKKMLLGNMEISLIMKITELPREKVEELKKELIENGQLEEKEK